MSTGEPTYWPTDSNKIPDLLDFFVYKGLSNMYLSAESCLDSSSDHTPLIATVSTTLIERSFKENLYNKNTDWVAFREYIESNANLKIALKTNNDIDKAATDFTNLIQIAAWKCTPILTRPGSKNIPKEVRSKVLEKRRLRRVWHTSRHASDRREFNRAAADLKQYLKDIEDETLKHRLENLDTTAKNEYSLWKTVKRSKNAPQTAQHPLKLGNNTWARKDNERAEAFGSFLAGVFTPNSGNTSMEKEIQNYLETDLQLGLPLKCCSPREIWGIIKDLELNKAPGYCLITTEILRQLPRKAIVFITQLFNGILRTGYFPRIWKVSEIIMIPKPGKPPHLVSSYRPISLLPVMSKLFEKVVARRLNEILKDGTIIPQHQFGFRMGHSTVEQVHRVVNKIREGLERKEYCSAVFLDVQQAFDKVWHQGLLFKVKKQLPHSLYVLIKSYLEDRIFRVKIDDSYSKYYNILAGVPQGSVLGPTLYLIYTADLPTSEKVLSATFADDTATLCKSNQIKSINLS